MPESQRRPEESPADTAKRGIRWDALAAIIASLVGLLALIVAGYTAYIQREQVSAQVWPYLIGGGSSNTELVWMNKGVGPAIVRSVEFTLDGKPQRNWAGVFKSLGIKSGEFFQSSFAGGVVSAGETLPWIDFMNKLDYASFDRAAARANMQVIVCYCSTLGDCWKTDFGIPGRRSVHGCPALPVSQQFQE